MAKTRLDLLLVERGLAGGTCVNTGCTPTKTMVASAYAGVGSNLNANDCANVNPQQTTTYTLTATNATRIYGLYPRKGTIAVGSDADLVVWDQDREVVITADLLHSACDYTPYEGMRVRGWPTLVFSRGEVVVEEGKLLAAPGRGRFLRCGRPSPLPA